MKGSGDKYFEKTTDTLHLISMLGRSKTEASCVMAWHSQWTEHQVKLLADFTYTNSVRVTLLGRNKGFARLWHSWRVDPVKRTYYLG